MAEAEAQKIKKENDKKEKEKRRKMIEELKYEAIELGAVQKQLWKRDEYWKSGEYGHVLLNIGNKDDDDLKNYTTY